MQDTQGKNNAQTLFGVFKIPTDNHIRSLLDAVEPMTAYSLFDIMADKFWSASSKTTFAQTFVR